MTQQQKQLIRELVQKYSEHIGTESLIAYIAETNGMLAACKSLLQSVKTGDSYSTDWLFRDCLKYNIVYHLFLEEISRLIVLFDPGQEHEDHFATLGLTPGAGKDEIKQAYRTLSPQYHPDTASPLHHDKPEKFIAINKAYNTLLTAQETGDRDEKNTPSKQWRKNRVRRYSIGQKKKLFMWASATLLISVIISTIVLITVQNKSMLAGLQKGRTVFVESIDTILKSIQPEAATDSRLKQQEAVEISDGLSTPHPSEKPFLAVQEEQTEQVEQIQQIKDTAKKPVKIKADGPPPESVTTDNNINLPDAQKLPVVTKSPEKIDTFDAATTVVKKPLENKPSVSNHTETGTYSSHEQQKFVEQSENATPYSPKEPLLALQENQAEQIQDTGKTPLKTTAEQPPPELVTLANNDTLPDAQKLPVATKDLENKPSVVSHTEAETDSSLELQKSVEKNELATPYPPEEPLLALQENQTEQIQDTGKTPVKTTAEQPSPELATFANNDTLPDTQKLNSATKSPDRIDTLQAAATVVQQPLNNKPSTVNHTKQHLKNKSAPPDNSIHTPADNLPIEKKEIKPDIQPRVNTFLNNYIQAYEQRNLTLFSKLFEANAVENGKPFTSLLPTYRELFAATSDITLKVENISWKEIDEEIAVQGSFKLDLQYNDSRKFSGTGSIRFVLMDNNSAFQVSILEYQFSGEN